MQFNSYSYLLCLVAAVVLFWAMPTRWRRGWVLAVSVAFYATWNPWFVVLPLALCVITYACAEAMRRDLTAARAPLAWGVGAILVVLAFFKYRQFIVDNIAAVLPLIKADPIPLAVLIGLPLGISFYSFEAISYLLDTRQKRVPGRSFTDLCLFIMFWPHLIAGPIVRSRELIPQLKFDRPFEARFVRAGIERLLLGLVQKNLLANGLASFVDDGFVAKLAPLNTTIDNWALAIAFGLQIYFDFAAYSNMAIGAALLIGVTLPENFRFPYHAATPPDFWSRWHMSLSRWIRDYIFFPLNAGFQDRKVRLYGSLVLVMGLVGFWHGAGWGFVAWGLAHGVLLMIYRVFAGDMQPGVVSALFWRAFTLAGVVAAWIPFRATTLEQAGTMWASMFWRLHFGFSYSVNFYLITLLCCGIVALEPLLAMAVGAADRASERVPWFGSLHTWLVRPMAYAGLLLLFLAFDDQDTQFIYFQF